jgi:hypothetical protein
MLAKAVTENKTLQQNLVIANFKGAKKKKKQNFVNTLIRFIKEEIC